MDASPDVIARTPRTALILTGGGARAAYQVGVMLAIVKLQRNRRRNPFPILSGTSAGAINAAGVACLADNFGKAVTILATLWRNMHASHIYRADPAGIGGLVDSLAEIGVTQDAGLLTGVAQGVRLMGAMKTVERKLADGTLLHDGSALMAWAAGNAKVRQTSTAVLIERAASGNTSVVKAKMAVMRQLGIGGAIEDILITLESQYHLIRPLTKVPTLFLYVAIDRQRGNLGLARHKLRQIEESLDL